MANRLSIILHQKGIRQDILANQLNVTPATISRWGSNTSQPPIEKLYLAANFLKVDMTELLYGEAKTLSASRKVHLSILETDDAYLKMVTGTKGLTTLQLAMLVFRTEFPNGNINQYSMSLMGYTDLYRPTHISLIEVGKIITDCRFTTVSVENSPEDLQLTFLCPSKPSLK